MRYSSVIGIIPARILMQLSIMTLGHSITMMTPFYLWYTQHLKADVEKNQKGKEIPLLRLL